MTFNLEMNDPRCREYLLNMDLDTIAPMINSNTISLRLPNYWDMRDIPQNFLESFANKFIKFQQKLDSFLPNIEVLFQLADDEEISKLMTPNRIKNTEIETIVEILIELSYNNKITSIKKLWGLCEEICCFHNVISNCKNWRYPFLACEYDFQNGVMNMNASQKWLSSKIGEMWVYANLKKIHPQLNRINTFDKLMKMLNDRCYWEEHLNILGITQTIYPVNLETNPNNQLKTYISDKFAWHIKLPHNELSDVFLPKWGEMIHEIQKNIEKYGVS